MKRINDIPEPHEASKAPVIEQVNPIKTGLDIHKQIDHLFWYYKYNYFPDWFYIDDKDNKD